MPAAIPLIAMGVSAGTSIYGAHQAANASKEAGQIQQTAAERAQDLIRNYQNQLLPMYQQGQAQSTANLSPYVNLGPTALNALGSMRGVNGQPMGGAPGGMPTMPPQTAMPPPGGFNLNTLGQPLDADAARSAAASEPKVWMENPDGERQQVPASAVPKYLQRGARLIGPRPPMLR